MCRSEKSGIIWDILVKQVLMSVCTCACTCVRVQFDDGGNDGMEGVRGETFRAN